MFRSLSRLLMLVMLLYSVSFSAMAQGETQGTLTVGQPVSAELAGESPARYDYTLAQPSLVTFQVISETAQPTISLVRDGKGIAMEPNTAGTFIASLATFLDAGQY